MGFECIDHFDLVVRDVDRALEFYQGLGIRTGDRKTGYGAIMKVLLLGDRERINVTTPSEVERLGRTVVAGGGHLCLVWKGTIDEVMEQLSRSGITPKRAPRSPRPGEPSQVFLVDPDDNLVEIIVYPE